MSENFPLCQITNHKSRKFRGHQAGIAPLPSKKKKKPTKLRRHIVFKLKKIRNKEKKLKEFRGKKLPYL